MSRIEYGLADIREVLELYPETEHPYTVEKLAERDGLLEQWQAISKSLRRLETAHNDAIHEQAGRDTFTVHMDLENSDFDGEPRHIVIAAKLRELAERVHQVALTSYPLQDYNGNTIGSAELITKFE